MSETSSNQIANTLDQYIEQYLSLESMEVTEELLDLCGATIDARALSLLRKRLAEEDTQISLFEKRGYIRMREKCEQLVVSLRPLIVALSQTEEKTGRENV